MAEAAQIQIEVKQQTPQHKDNSKKGIIAAVVLILGLALGLGLGLGLGLAGNNGGGSSGSGGSGSGGSGGGTTSTPNGGSNVTMAVVVAGDVSDFTPAVETAMRQKVADQVGAPIENVAMTVESASVRITFMIDLPTATEATTAAALLSTQLASTSSASTFLTTTERAVTVESVATQPSTVAEDGSMSEVGSSLLATSGFSFAEALTVITAKSNATADSRRLRRRLNVPTQGDYADDETHTYVTDDLNDYMMTAEEIMCVIASARADAPEILNQGPYVALVDFPCTPALKAAAQGGSGPKRMSLIATRLEGGPQVLKGHIEFSQGPPQDGVEPFIFIHVTTEAAPSEDHPNGVFEMQYSLVARASTPGGVVMQQAGRGMISARNQSLVWLERSTNPSNPSQVRNSRLATGSDAFDTGYGYLQAEGEDNIDMAFGYSGDAYCRGGANVSCYNRGEAAAKAFVWQYGLYDPSGDKFELGTPGFSLRRMGAGGVYEYGYASYDMLYLPGENLADGAALEIASPPHTQLTLKLGKGTLHKVELVSDVLNSIAHLPLIVYLGNSATLTLGGVPVPAGSYITIAWDTSSGAFVLQSVQSSGGTTHAGVPVSALNVSNAVIGGTLAPYVSAWGTTVIVPLSTLTAADPGAGAISYQRTTQVQPMDTSVPTTLKCVYNCPTAARVTNLAHDGSRTTTYTPATLNNYNDPTTGVDAQEVVTYTWDAAAYTLNDPTGSAVNTDAMPPYPDGVNPTGSLVDTGILVAASDLNHLECSFNTSQYCYNAPGTNSITTYYQWSFSRNEVNNPRFLRRQDGSYVAFSPPVSVKYTVPADPPGPYAGAPVVFTYNGDGFFNGIPYLCYDSAGNEVEMSNCGDDGYHIGPAFDIPSGAAVDVGGQQKYVKQLRRSLEFPLMPGMSASDLGVTMGSLSVLPAAIPDGDAKDPSIAANTRYYAGSLAEANFNRPPAVRLGIIQVGRNVTV